MYRPLAQLILSRIREFYREPSAIFWVYGFPLIMALALGFAFQSKPIEVIAIDLVKSEGRSDSEMEERVKKLVELDNRLKIKINDEATARNRLRSDRTALLLFPENSVTQYRLEFDNNRPSSVLAKSTLDMLLIKLANPMLVSPQVDQMQSLTGGRYIDFLLPGLIGTNLMGGGLFGVGFLIVDMRVRKLLKRFLATPMKKTDFMLAIMTSRLMFTLLDIAILLVAGALFFQLKVYGNWLALMILILAGGSCFAGMGMVIASRAKTLESGSGLLNAIMLPNYILGGVFFSISTFPEWSQPILQALPLTALNDGMRAIINEGRGFDALGYPLLVLGAWGLGSFALAVKLFRWK
jgi:ABC-2 type transport system permease protein